MERRVVAVVAVIAFIVVFALHFAPNNPTLLSPSCPQNCLKNVVDRAVDKNKGVEENKVMDKKPTCNKFILFTMRRSGSGWLCEGLNHHPEVVCLNASEPLRRFAFAKKAPTEETSKRWMHEVDKVFDDVCEEAKKTGKRIAGFKIMYNQVMGPGRYVNGVYVPNEWLQDHLEKRNVRILQLVRDAAILSMASWTVSHHSAQKHHLDIKHALHTTDPKIAEMQIMTDPKFNFAENHVKTLLHDEHTITLWTDFLQLTGLPYFYVRYEDLISRRQNVSFYNVLQFLGIKNRVPYPKFQGQYLRSHEAKCEDRFYNFENVTTLIKGTMSEQACAELRIIDTFT